jgi:hypothetical protein
MRETTETLVKHTLGSLITPTRSPDRQAEITSLDYHNLSCLLKLYVPQTYSYEQKLLNICLYIVLRVFVRFNSTNYRRRTIFNCTSRSREVSSKSLARLLIGLVIFYVVGKRPTLALLETRNSSIALGMLHIRNISDSMCCSTSLLRFLL